MAQLPLPPVPNTPIVEKNPTADSIWHRWFEQLRTRLTLPGQQDHNALSNLQGGTTNEYYHFTSAQHGELTGDKTANTVYAGPSTGAAAPAAFRALVAADFPAGTGTVTSVSGTGTVNGITLTGTVTTSGNLTLGGALSGVSLTTQVTGILPTANGGTGTNGAWTSWTPTRTGWTDVGAPTVTASYVRIANIVYFQIKVVPNTTVATTAATSYTDLPVAASGLSGDGSMQDLTALTTVGGCMIDVANSRCYVPSQAATGDTLLISGWYQA